MRRTLNPPAARVLHIFRTCRVPRLTPVARWEGSLGGRGCSCLSAWRRQGHLFVVLSDLRCVWCSAVEPPAHCDCPRPRSLACDAYLLPASGWAGVNRHWFPPAAAAQGASSGSWGAVAPGGVGNVRRVVSWPPDHLPPYTCVFKRTPSCVGRHGGLVPAALAQRLAQRPSPQWRWSLCTWQLRTSRLRGSSQRTGASATCWSVASRCARACVADTCCGGGAPSACHWPDG